jgi:hypothetical protein
MSSVSVHSDERVSYSSHEVGATYDDSQLRYLENSLFAAPTSLM